MELILDLRQQAFLDVLQTVFGLMDRETMRERGLARTIARSVEELNLEDVENLSFYVCEGKVSIYGNIYDPADRDFVANLVERIPGVQAVKVNLVVVEKTSVLDEISHLLHPETDPES